MASNSSNPEVSTQASEEASKAASSNENSATKGDPYDIATITYNLREAATLTLVCMLIYSWINQLLRLSNLKLLLI